LLSKQITTSLFSSSSIIIKWKLAFPPKNLNSLRKLKNHLWKICLAEAPVELEDLSFGVLQLLWRGVNLQSQVHHPANVHKVQDLKPMRAG
jgi:hypothetical protein